MRDMACNPRPAVEFHYQIAGRFLSVEFPDFTAVDSVDRYLSVLRATRVDRIGDSGASRLILRNENAEALSELIGCYVTEEAGTETSFYSTPSLYAVRLGNSTVRAGIDRTVLASLADDLDRQSVLFERVLAHALATALRRAGAFELHSAAVVDPETSISALIVGPSGSGKSTLALQLAASGWKFSSDDVVLLTASAEKVDAFGLREHFALTTETVTKSGVPGLAPGLLGKTVGLDHKLVLKPENVFPSQHLRSCIPEVLIFAHRAEAPQSRLEAITQADAMKRLLRITQAASLDLPTAGELLNILGRLARQCRAFDLHSGTDLLGDRHYTARFLGTIIERQAA